MGLLTIAAVALAVSSAPAGALVVTAGPTSSATCQPCHDAEPALALLLPRAQRGAEETERVEATVGPTLICNTPQQLTRFVNLINAGGEAMDAIRRVNEEAKNPTACGNALAEFEIGKTLDAVKMLGELVGIVEVKVTALNDGSEWMSVPPTTQYTLRRIPGETL